MSVSAHWSANWRIKKTLESHNSFGEGEPGKKTNLRDDYEQLREYFLSPAKTPSRPLGLDLWLKKGFLSWGVTMASRTMQSASYAPTQSKSHDITADLVLSLSNILVEWSNKNIRRHDKRGTYNMRDISLHMALHPSF